MSAPPEFEAFVLREHSRLVGALTLYCGDVALAEELTQDTLVRVREQWRRVSNADRPGAYAHRIAINLCNSRFRRRAAERRAVARTAARAVEGGAHHDPCGADGLAVREAVASLPPRQREVIVRRYFLDESPSDVAAAMTISTGTVASSTSRAIATLRATFDVSLPTPVGAGATKEDRDDS